MGSHPVLALSGREIPLTASSVLTKEVWRKLVFSFMTSEQIETLAQLKKLDLAVDLKEIGQFRALVSVVDETYNLSIYAQGRVPAAVAAVAPAVAPAEPAPPSQPPPAPSASTAPAAPAAPVTPQAAASPAPAPVVVAAPAIQVPGLMPGQVLGLPVPASHPYREGDVSVDELLAILLDKGGSDLHLHERKQPLIRTDGRLIIAHEKPIDDYNMMAIIEHVTNETERALLFARDDLDTAYNMKALSRFRVNILRDTRGWGMVLRVIPFKIPVWKDLGVPESAHSLVFKPHGLFLVTGPTGSGKSTTLASLIHDVNQTHYKHIVTIEDPIEFVHNDIKCCVTQREVGVDTPSFARGVVDVLRQDPDLILVGEMRDLETMANALLAAESGRLVLATLHTTSCAQTIERIINVFPEEAQNVARSQLANSIVGILSQSLLPKKGGGRIAAFEVMIATESVRNLLRENKPQMLQTSIETGAKFGMRSLDQHLLELVEGGQVAFEDAYAKCQNTKNFKALEAKLKGVPVAALAEE